jgi:hypothetical protein
MTDPTAARHSAGTLAADRPEPDVAALQARLRLLLASPELAARVSRELALGMPVRCGRGDDDAAPAVALADLAVRTPRARVRAGLDHLSKRARLGRALPRPGISGSSAASVTDAPKARPCLTSR